MVPVVQLEGAGKKFCRTLKRSMLYGLSDIGRNLVRLSSHPATLRAGEFWAVDDATFSLNPGETLGIMGPNGSGKSTILKLLNGIYWPDKGRIMTRGKVGALIEVGAGFHPLLTGRENIFLNAAILGMKKHEVDSLFNEIVDFADIGPFLDTPVKNYSSGMFVRLGFSIAVHCRPQVLLIDEILAVGDYGFQTRCFHKVGELKKNGTAIILVSHNAHLVSTYADAMVVFQRGRATFFREVGAGVDHYCTLFRQDGATAVEKVVTGNETLRIHDVSIEKTRLSPGEDFSIRIPYHSRQDVPDIMVDMCIYTEDEQHHYFQATNRSYGRRIDLPQGEHQLAITIRGIPVNNVRGTIAVAIWNQERSERLFWWRVPVEFSGQADTHGRNFLPATFELLPKTNHENHSQESS